MYLKMFGFAEKPFHITPDPRFIFLSKNHKEAFAHLLYGIQQRLGFLSLVGEVGTGKTTVLRTLLGQLEEAEYRVALIFNPCLSALELLQTIHREFAIAFDPQQDNLVALYDSLNLFLLQQREAGKTVVLVVDEAQNLDPKVLEQLRLLSNLETETEKLIQMVLVGQPELDQLLQRRDLRQLRQRMAVCYRLQPMDAEDSGRYVRHRIKVAGCRERTIFTPGALKQIFRFTRGTPRLINILCDRALLVAFSRDSHSVSRQDIQVAQKELQRDGSRPTRFVAVFGGLLLVVILVFASLQIVNDTSLDSAPVSKKPPLVSSTAQQQASVLPEVPAIVVETGNLRAEQIESLRQEIAGLTVEDSGLQSALAVAAAWQRPLPARLPAVNGRRSMQRILALLGFDLAEINITTADILKLDAPIVLEINLPNVTGKRFIAVNQVRGEQLQTIPAITDSGWLSIADLNEIWFGKAMLPYINYLKIPLLDRPNKSGRKVIELQRLLNRLKGDRLTLSGIYDKPTIAMVTRFQQQHQLAPDGRVGAQTLYWLYRQTGRDMPRLTVGDGS
ncbi:MAG: AAA family ATPase [Deltaproteobacteria bacterium]|nr:AAA family ATPase [Deltaproteobacteria bacterium]